MVFNKNAILGNNDIVSGRGRGYERLEGNKVFRKLIKSHASAYSDPKSSRSRKSRIVTSLWITLSKKGMRMLKNGNDEDWVEMSEGETQKKIAHALRDAKVERKLSSQAKECLKALDQYNTIAYNQILKSLPTLSNQRLEESLVENEFDWCGDAEREHGFRESSVSHQEVIDSFRSLEAFASPHATQLKAHRETGTSCLLSEDERDYDEVDFLLDAMIVDASADEGGSVSSDIDEYVSIVLPC